MFQSQKKLLLAFCLLLFTNFCNAQTASIGIPLSVINVGQNDYKVGIKVSVAGGPPSLVTFDTGGTGLHIFASQVGDMDISYTQQHIKSSFLSGLVYEGVIALAPVKFGKLSTPPIPILVIQKAYCQKNKPHCGAGSDPNHPSLVMGHFYGELGAGMIPEQHDDDPQKTLFAPFRALPGHYGNGFIIENLGKQGGGRLRLGFNSKNTVGFNRVKLPVMGSYQDGSQYYNDKSVKVQYSINGFGKTLRTAFDTGGGSAVQLFTGNKEGYPLRRHLVIPQQNFNASLPGIFEWEFMTGYIAGLNRVRVAPVIPAKGPFVNTGISFFLHYNVIYDFKHGMLGFRPHGDEE